MDSLDNLDIITRKSRHANGILFLLINIAQANSVESNTLDALAEIISDIETACCNLTSGGEVKVNGHSSLAHNVSRSAANSD